MIALKAHHQHNGALIKPHKRSINSPKTNPRTTRNQHQIPQPIKSWTKKPVRINEKQKENGIITSPRMLAGKGATVPVKQTVGGEWALKECEEHTAWVNGLLKKGRLRPIGDLRKSISDGLMLVSLLEILFHTKIAGIQIRPIIRAQRLENIHLCLRFLEGKGVEIQQLSADEITDGNLQAALEVISAIRRRFESNYTGSSITNGSSTHSVDGKSHSDLILIPPIGDGSINSQFTGSSLGTPRGLQNGDAKGAVNGDILPGTMADEPPEESPRVPIDAGNIMSTTEINTEGISQQHGIEMRRQKFHNHPVTSQIAIRPQPLRPPSMASAAWNTTNGGLPNGRSPAVRESLSMTVEERLKSLLDTPNPGGMNGGSQYLYYDEGELLELPPPKLRSYLNDDDDDDEDNPDENDSQLNAMLEDPDRFEDYPKDWDRYVSGYVPSSKAERKEGPRALSLLDQPADEINQTSQNRSLQFFHAPPTQHMGPMQNGYHNGPQAPEPETNGMYSMQTPNRLQNSSYQSPSSAGQKMLPSYQDHIQRHPMRGQNQYSRGHNPMPRGHDPERTGGTTTPSAFRPPNNFDPHSRGSDSTKNSTPPNSMHFIPAENIRPNHAYTNTSHTNHRTNEGLARTTNGPNNTLHNLNGPMRGLQGFVPSPSSSSSRSNTPELPPLSPATTPSNSPPDSPEIVQKTPRSLRSLSVTSFPFSLRSNHSEDREVTKATQEGSRSAGKKKRSPFAGRHAATVPNKTPEIKKKGGSKENGEKSKKKGSRSRSSTLQSANGDMQGQKKKTKTPNTHRRSSVADQHYLTSSDDDIKPPPKPERKQRRKIAPSLPQPPRIPDGSLEGANSDSIREQLVALESMYKDILQVMGTNKSEPESKKPVRRQISTMASPRAIARPKSAAKTQKQRANDIKLVNKRFARVESHVVTLARSVASLSSEIRSQNAILREIDDLRSEVDILRDSQIMSSLDVSMMSSRSKYRPIIPPHTSPQKIKKLTKFFGEEPPLLRMFLQELGYEKYAAIFEKEGIGMMELPYLTEERLELIGIPIGPRLRILQEAQLIV